MATDRSLLVLGWPDVLTQLAAGCRTLAGARAVPDLALLGDASAIRAVYQAVRELHELELGGVRCPVGAVTDIGGSVERAGRGLTLECEDLRNIGSGLEGLNQVRKWAESVAEEAPNVFLLAHPIEVDTDLTDTLRRSFDATGQLSGTEYPILDELRRRKESLKSRLQGTLDELLRDDGLGSMLQERYVTERNGRFVLPVKASFRKGLGIVHGTSQSGETVFVEPAAVVELHNDLTEAEATLYREERRILGELSHRVGRGRAQIQRSLDASVRLDLVCARVTFGFRIGGTVPNVQTEGVLVVHEARHPLLALSAAPPVGARATPETMNRVIANDLSLTERVPGLVLTGPNAGGKTVALKTLGLFALLVRAGVPVPAAAGARVDLFDPIFADIGDGQSVAEGLSTFSAHVQSLTHAIAVAGPGALVLIDEITAGTDPSQGAALARAVVERLVDAGARVAVTTHFPEMKALAGEDRRFAVAAAQFVDGKPTFRLETGSPGASHALSIARRVGMPEAVLERASEVMDSSARALARQLEALDEERGRARQQTERLLAERADMTARLEALAAREEALARRVDRAVAEEVERAKARLKVKEEEVRVLVAALQANPDMRTANETLRLTREAGLDMGRVAGPAGTEAGPAAGVGPALSSAGVGPALVAGQRARHTRLGIVDVLELPAGEKARVSLRGMVSWVAASDLSPLVGQEKRVEARKAASRSSGGVESRSPGSAESRSSGGAESRSSPRSRGEVARRAGGGSVGSDAEPLVGVHVAVGTNTIDLRGFRVEDAFPAIEAFFDAHTNRTSVVFLLHGHGTGALKQGLRQWLPNSRYVREFRPANAEEGGDALTVVRLQ